MSKLSRKEKQAAKRAANKEKYDNLTKTQKRVGFGIVALIAISFYSCSTLEAPVEPSEPEQVVTVPVEGNKPSEQAVVKPKQPKEVGIRSADAKRACNELIKAETDKFAKVDINYLSDSAFLKDASGKATASIGFTVDDGYGVEVPFTGYCYFNLDESLRAFEIQEGN